MSAWVPTGRTMHRVKVPRPDGSRVERSTGTRDRNTARKMQAMVETLGPRELRAWDVLERVTGAAPRVPLATLWDWWVADNRDLTKIRARLADEDLAPRVEAWLDAVRLRASADTAAHYAHAVSTLRDARGEIRRSALTPERLTAWLASRTKPRVARIDGRRVPTEVPLSTGARRKYYAALASFLGYLRSVGVLTGDLLADVPTPAAGAPRDRHLETAEVLPLVAAQPDPFRTIAALGAGTGIELSVVLGLRVVDVDVVNHEVHARGTKTRRHGPWRDRFVRVATWAWPYVATAMAGKARRDLLFPGVDRWAVGAAHQAACRALEIRDYAFRDHRHTYAVRAVRAGTPLEVVARALGHKDVTLVARVYGRYVPSQDERDKWERIAAAQDQAASGSHSGSRGGVL